MYTVQHLKSPVKTVQTHAAVVVGTVNNDLQQYMMMMMMHATFTPFE